MKKIMNKSAFVRSVPSTTPAKDVVAQAKAKGMKITVAYVYSIRTAARARAKGLTPIKGGKTDSKVVHIQFSKPADEAKAEDLLLACAATIGLGRALDLLNAQRAKVRAVIGE